MNNPICPAYIKSAQISPVLPEPIYDYPAKARKTAKENGIKLTVPQPWFVQPKPDNTSRTIYVIYAVCVGALWVLLATGGF